MSTADTIYELVKTLPEEQANLVLMFTQFVRQQTAQPQGQTPLTATADLSAWSTLVHDLSGTWSDFPEPETLRATLGQDAVRETL
ncbi:hypothetical protein C7271_26450 [filamentous cyanobacterium CCP5]|nr:hypothetical protein C7271_26450 [filamentous cyanobacterium CCP5]